jgi:hypothetical protein
MALPNYKVILINHQNAQRTEVVINAANGASAMSMARAMYPGLTPLSARPA